MNVTVFVSKIDEIASRIVDSFREANQHKTECIHAGRQAVLKAIETGALLNKAKKLVGHGNWEKWFADNIADQAGFSLETACRFIKLSKASKMTDLKDADSLTKAYIAAGIIADTKPPKPAAIGMGQVDIIEEAFNQLTKRNKSLLAFAADAQPEAWPDDRRAALKTELAPLVELYQKL